MYFSWCERAWPLLPLWFAIRSPLVEAMSRERNCQERAQGWGDQVWASLQLHEVPIFHGVSLSLTSLVLVELKGRGCKKNKSGNRITKLVRSLWLYLILSSSAGMQGGDRMGKSQGQELFPVLSLLRAAPWLEPSSGELQPAIEEFFELGQRAVLGFLLRTEYK